MALTRWLPQRRSAAISALAVLTALAAGAPAPLSDSAAASAAGASSSSAPAPPSGACVLFIPSSLVGFGLGSLRANGAVAPLWATADAWSGVLGGAFAARGAGADAFVMQPTLASGTLPLATFRLRAGGTNASVAYDALAPVPGHEAVGAPAVLGLVDDAARGRVVVVASSADGAFSYYALTSFAVNASSTVQRVDGGGEGRSEGEGAAGAAASAVAASASAAAPPAVPLRMLRDVTAEVAALGGQLLFGVATASAAADETAYLAFATSANESTVAAFSLANASAPAVLLALPRGFAVVSLQWSRVAAAGGRPGLLALAQSAERGVLEWLALDAAAPASLAPSATASWTTLFAFAQGVSAPEIGVGAVSADGATLYALVLDPTGQQLSASLVDVASRAECARITFADKSLIAVDIAECAAK
jgi:hypothetical protein